MSGSCRHRLVRLIALGFGALVCQTTVAASARLVWHACPPTMTSSAGAGAGAGVPRCATLVQSVRLADRPVRLAVVRLRAPAAHRGTHPIVFVPGGPGDSANLRGVGLRAWQRFQRNAGWPADLVLYDPRGTGASEPRVGCPTTGQTRHSLATCFDHIGRATAEQLTIDDHVRDLHRLIVALGDGPVTLWAQSFGAQVAFRLAQRFPDDVRGMILDAPDLTVVPLAARTRAAMQARVATLIAACRDDIRCRLRPPSARFVLLGWLAGLARHPLDLSRAVVPYRPQTLRVGPTKLLAAWLFSGYGATYGDAPVARMRDALADSQQLWPLVAPVLGLAEQTPSQTPVFWSSRCSVQSAATPPSLSDANPVPDRYLPAITHPCRDWPVPSQRTPALAATIGGLLVVGSDDPLVSSRRVRAFARMHPRFGIVRVAGGGHASLRDSGCAQRIVKDWLSRFSSVSRAPAGHDHACPANAPF